MKRTISVTGNGSAQAPPDMMTVVLGLESRDAGAGKAYDDVGVAAAAVTTALRGRGVGDNDMRTEGLNLRAELDWQEGHGQRVTGYVASTFLRVNLRELGGASAAIAAAVDAGGDAIRVNGVEPGFSDPTAVTASAQDAAWRDAAGKAAQFADLASAVLGKVVTVVQHPAGQMPIPLGGGMVRAAASATDGVALEAGETTVNASVSVTWEIV